MKIKLNQKIIKEICGTVSFKRGEALYRTNKVTIEQDLPDQCSATVTGLEDFHVTIEKDVRGGFRTSCSCPTLASYQKDCQHIAAVLLTIYEDQRRGTIPKDLPAHLSNTSSYKERTNDLLNLFNDHPVRSSGSQLHFENREMLHVEFICKLVPIAKGRQMFGIEMKIGPVKVKKIREFLEHVKSGSPIELSPQFTYDSNRQCFQKETDDVIKQLIYIIQDEKVFMDAFSDNVDGVSNQQIILLPPSIWERLIPLLERAPLVNLEYDGKIYEGLQLSNEPLSIQFNFAEAKDKGYQLEVKGLNEIVVLNSYPYVLEKEKLIQLENDDIKRLIELKQMLEASESNQIPIHQDQVGFFLEKVVPGLNKLGNVQISKKITEHFVKIPLIAKLYLDRVHDRLLAGLEFHYENRVINPLESRVLKRGPMFMRDVAKEEAIIQLMEDSSFFKTESGYFLHNEELEYDFLFHVVPKLQTLVQIYATTAVRSRVFSRSSRPMIRVKMKKERTNWLEFKFEMDGIPEKEIREVLSALEEKRKYYRLRNGSLMSLESREFEAMKRFLNELPVQKEDLEKGLDVPIVRGFHLLDSVDDPDAFRLEESFRQFLQNIKNPDRLAFDIPKGMETILRDYQKDGYIWMKTLAQYGFGGILADDMGLGKTLQSITFILSELADIRKSEQPILIVCPSSLTYNWLSELTKFAPEVETIVVDGNKTDRTHLLKDITKIDVLITSYSLLRRDIKWYEKQSFHTAFFDEAQYFKNPITQTAKAVKKIRAEYRFALTGTPVENSLEELWSIYHVVFPELFLGIKEYSKLSRAKIARRIQPFLLRRMKKDVLSELPEKIESMESVELLPDQKKLYAAYLAKLRHDTLKHLDKDTLRKNRIRILAGLTRLRQICCHPALFVDGYNGSSAKFERLMRIIEESKLTRRRVLIFSQFTKMLDLIGRELTIQGLPFFYLDGQTPSGERVELCNRFNGGERDLFLISLKAGGTGLNLTGADTVILYDLWWNPAVEEQASDRAYRMGQTNIVQVIKLIARGTIEEKMNELQLKKKHLIEEIIDPDEKMSTMLTDEDIRELLMI